MDTINGYISANPVAVTVGVILVVLFILNIIFKSTVKLFIAILIIATVAYGYFYFRSPSGTPKSPGDVVKAGITQIKDTGKNFISDGKDLYKKGKSAPKEVDKMLDSSNKELDKELKK